MNALLCTAMDRILIPAYCSANPRQGSGADETMTDYGFNGKRIYSHSQFGGYWPDDATL